VATDEKSNEITAIPALLNLLEIKGLIVTIDAMGCQTAIATQIVRRGADYVLAMKDNQKNLHQDIRETFAWGRARGFKGLENAESEQIDKGHGRIEKRRVTVLWELGLLRDAAAWTGLRCIAEVECERTVLGGGPDGGDTTTTDRRYFISSVQTRGANEIARACRAHWGVENGLHWRLDTAFREDEPRARTGHAAENLSRVNRIALNLLTLEPSKKSIRRKRLRAGWDHDYLLAILRMGTK
jgi:predicted transposase YbfD/YdcC